MSEIIVHGGRSKISGKLRIGGAKNAALPMLCAALLTDQPCTFREVPNISDVDLLLDIFEQIGVSVERDTANHTARIEAKNLTPNVLKKLKDIKKMRASILMLGPLISRFADIEIPSPGGCVLGARSNEIHLDGFREMGLECDQSEDGIRLKHSHKFPCDSFVLLSEASVTATENLAILAAGVDRETRLFFTAGEQHVVALLKMLQSMGADLSGIGTHQLTIRGTKTLRGGEFVIPSDDIQAGTYAIAALLTQGRLQLENVNHLALTSLYGIWKKMGAEFSLVDEDTLELRPSPDLRSPHKLQTAIYPGFATDLQAPMGVLLTQCQGETLVFETLFENRLSYLLELEKMGADITILNQHQALVRGPAALKGTAVQSWDLRAGAAMILAGLVAKDQTTVSQIEYIERGYEDFANNLRKLGGALS